MAKTYLDRGDILKASEYNKKADQIEDGTYASGNLDRWERDYYAPEVYEDWAYDGRNYVLFGVLAGVRNEEVTPIAEPKGLPEDMSYVVREAADQWHGDGHSRSYLTLQELKAYNWEDRFPRTGTLSEASYRSFLEDNNPYPFSGGVYGQNVVHLSAGDMNKLLLGEYPRDNSKSYYTEITWHETVKDTCGSFYSESLSKLEKLSTSDDYSDVRLVFWFDN